MTRDMDYYLVKEYRDAAVKTTLQCLNRTKGNILKTYGCIPEKINEAIVFLFSFFVEKGTQQIKDLLMYIPDEEFDAKIKEYINLKDELAK